LGFFGGRWLDGRFGTEPWLQLLGFVAGLGAAAKAVLRASRQMNKIAEAESREQGDPAPLFDKEERAASDEQASVGWREPPPSPAASASKPSPNEPPSSSS
jgi:ATP synthase protein I